MGNLFQMKQFKDTNGAFIIPLKENDRIFGIMQVKIQRRLQGVRKTFGIRKDSYHKLSERSFKRRRQ